MEGVFIFKTQVYQKLEMRFPLYEHSLHFLIYSIKVFSQLLFLFSKIAEIGRIPLWYFSRLSKLWEYYPSFIRMFIDILFHKSHLDMATLSMHNHQFPNLALSSLMLTDSIFMDLS
jgi:hypothetical protein